MTGDFEAVGDIATGAVAAHAIGGAGAGHAGGHESVCANCGTALLGPHCHRCGQSGHVHRTATALFHDIAHGVFHFEGRTWHTLPLLFWKPGELTRRYAHGERVKFVSPMALFLFSVFLMVATFSSVHSGGEHSTSIVGKAEAAGQLARKNTKMANLAAERDALQAKPVKSDDDREKIGEIDDQLAELKGDVAELKLVAAGKIAPGTSDPNKVDGSNFKTGIPGVDSVTGHFTKNPELAVYKLKSASYKYSWALIPISLPFIWLIFCLRRDVGFYDHAIFATYSLSAMTIMITALWIAAAIGLWPALLWTIALIFPPWHMYRQLKGAYRLGRFGAIWRTIFLVIAAYTSAIIFFTTILVMELKD